MGRYFCFGTDISMVNFAGRVKGFLLSLSFLWPCYWICWPCIVTVLSFLFCGLLWEFILMVTDISVLVKKFRWWLWPASQERVGFGFWVRYWHGGLWVSVVRARQNGIFVFSSISPLPQFPPFGGSLLFSLFRVVWDISTLQKIWNLWCL